MTDWMEVFMAGDHISADGVKRAWTVADLEKMAKLYDPGHSRAPIVVGHPKTNAPAFGWVKALKVHGNKLLALPDQVAPEFTELVKAGRYKKRSISVYPDGTLRHVGFLGGYPPAVKGLKDIQFSEDSETTYEYAEENFFEDEKIGREIAAKINSMKIEIGEDSAATSILAEKNFSEDEKIGLEIAAKVNCKGITLPISGTAC